MTDETKKKRHGIGWYIKFVLGGNIFKKTDLKKNAAFGFFLLGIVILFISNTFIAENKLRDIKKAKEAHRIARIKFIEMRTKLKSLTRPSKLYDQVQVLELEEPKDPPRKIIIHTKH